MPVLAGFGALILDSYFKSEHAEATREFLDPKLVC